EPGGFGGLDTQGGPHRGPVRHHRPGRRKADPRPVVSALPADGGALRVGRAVRHRAQYRARRHERPGGHDEHQRQLLGHAGMTAYTAADEIAAVWRVVRPAFPGAFPADTYQVRRDVRVSDGMGNSTTTEQTVESGRCQLITLQAQGREAYSGPVLQAVYR